MIVFIPHNLKRSLNDSLDAARGDVKFYTTELINTAKSSNFSKNKL